MLLEGQAHQLKKMKNIQSGLINIGYLQSEVGL